MGIQVMSTSDSTDIAGSIFVHQNYAVDLYSGGYSHVNYSYFQNCTKAIKAYLSHGLIEHCEFNNNQYDVNELQAWLEIQYNNFSNTKYVAIIPWAYNNQQSTANNNNFFSTRGYFIQISNISFPYAIVHFDFDARYNFWNTSNISALLDDAGNNSSNPNYPCPYYITYIPKISTKISTAGIQ